MDVAETGNETPSRGLSAKMRSVGAVVTSESRPGCGSPVSVRGTPESTRSNVSKSYHTPRACE